MPDPRRMRRFRDSEGIEYDELPDGQVRKRLNRGDPSPYPRPQSREAVEKVAGVLTEIASTVLARDMSGRGGYRSRSTGVYNPRIVTW